ncbi:MAG: type IX secretion system membrane protein PorP/SprF [Flavobacteriales bacterium]|jgi:type IX secretion system PorP/SprF family membrane protein|nr:type IX secretion system membrane protein PorP/SprF [Flavobacteriales bacterium]MDC0459826.1 type IX secretion system membrane protein PorP/SprF [Crocinitomicaceae bacterium]
MKTTIFIFALTICGVLNAQQIPQYSQFQRNQFMINPAAAGVYDFVDITMSGRWQWLGVDDSPKTSYLAFSVPVRFTPKYYNPGIRTSSGPVENPDIKTGKLKHTFGGQLLADQYGAFRKFSFSGTYAIHMPITKKVNLSFGVKAGLSNNSFLADQAQVLNIMAPDQNQYNDPTYDNFIQNQSNKYIMDVGAGLYLYSKNLFFGLAAEQLTRDMVEFGQGTANFDPQLHYSILGGYKIPINNNFTLTPGFLIKYMTPAPVSIDANIQLEYKNWLWMTLGYRHTDAVIAMVGMNISKRFKFGYSYDFSVSRFNSYSSGGHELTLGLMIGR